MKNIFIIMLAVSCFVAFNSCSSKSKPGKEKEEAHEPHGDEPENENIVTLTEEQVKAIAIEFGTIEQKELTHSIKANGVLTVPNQNKAFVTSLYGGVVRSLKVQPGTAVQQGQTIAIVVNPALIQIQQQLKQVQVQIALSEIEGKRQKELVEGNAAPLKRLQQVQAELATLKSQRTGLQMQLSAAGAPQGFSSELAVKAPISGTISKVRVQLGSNVDISTPIAEIVNNSQLHLDLYVYEKDLPKVEARQTIHFTITNNAGKEYDAEIFSIGTAFEDNSKAIPVHAKVIGSKTGLLDGMNVTALISLDQSTVPAVPADAIVSYQGRDFIFAVMEEEDHAEKKMAKSVRFEKIPVVKGTTDVGFTEITLLKNLPPGGKIVVKGAFFVLAKMTNSGEVHAH